VAHASFDLGRTLAQAGARAAAERSTGLFEDAIGEFRALGMEPWERKALRALDELEVQAG
jgi:hypothetical protein